MHRSPRALVLLLAVAAAIAIEACGTTPPADAPSAPAPSIAEVPPAAEPEPEAAVADSRPAASEEAPAEPPKAQPPRATPEMLGTLVSRNGNDITIEAAADPLPAAGATGTLFKRFEQDFGSIKASGWLGIADVTVKKVDARRLVLTMTAEKSTVVVNGKKVDHFTSGSQVKLDLSP